MLKLFDAAVGADPIDVYVDGDTVRLTVHGRLDAKLGEQVMQELREVTAAGGVSRLYMDCRLAIMAERTLDHNRRVNAIDDEPLLRGLRTALVCTVRTTDLVYLESLARHHGHAFKVFTDGEQAMRWLEQAS